MNHTLQTMKRLALIVGTLMCLISSTKAQQLQASLSHYSINDGLPSEAISYITQDKYGYIWLATWNGLSRFDGFNFYNYKMGPASGVPLLHNRIIDIKIDTQQNLWLRMYDGRLFMLDRKTDTFKNVFEGIDGYETFRTKHALTITANGYTLVEIDGVGIYKVKYEQEKGFSHTFIPTGGVRITAMVEGYKNELLVGTYEGVKKMQQGKDKLDEEALFPEERVICMHSNGFNVYAGTQSGKLIDFTHGHEPEVIADLGTKINSVYADSHGQLWYSINDFGVFRMDVSTKQTKHFTQKISVPEYDVNGASITEVDGRLWVMMNHGGFGYYNPTTDEIEYFHNNPDNPWDLSNTVTTFLALKEGVIWESTMRRGLDKLMLTKKTIKRTRLFEDTKEVERNEIRAMYYDKQQKQLMLGNKRGGLFIIKDGQQTFIPDDGKGHEFGRIYGINKDRMGNYWICSKGKGLFKMVTRLDGTRSFEHYGHNSNDPYSISHNNVYNTAEDKYGNLWVATYEGGVNIMVKDKQKGHKFLNVNNIMNYPKDSYYKARTVVADNEGNIWVGTTDGLLVMRYENDSVSIKKINETNQSGDLLQCNDIVCLAKHHDGTIWIGSNGGGLSHCKGRDKDGKWFIETYGYEDGMPSNEVMSITFDDRGNVWFATDHAIGSFNINKGIFSTFSMLDGVDDTFCSETAAITMPNDIILFGTHDGYYTVDLKNLVDHSSSTLKLKITDFFIDYDLMSPRLNSTFNYYVPDSKEVVLPENGLDFSVRFASLNYHLQHRVHYQYMLEGYDDVWHNADDTRMASYNNLPAGSYELKIKAFLLESPDNFDQRSIIIHVPAHFLLSRGAVIAYIILGVLLIVSAFFIFKKKEKKNENSIAVGSRLLTIKDKNNMAFMKKQLKWIERHYKNKEMKITDLVEQAGMSRTDYYNTLKAISGLTPKELIYEIRISMALKLMDDYDSTVMEAARRTGFEDEEHFRCMYAEIRGREFNDMR